MRKTYLAQVLCKNDSCYQSVSEDFVKEHPNMKFVEVLEDIYKRAEQNNPGIIERAEEKQRQLIKDAQCTTSEGDNK